MKFVWRPPVLVVWGGQECTLSRNSVQMYTLSLDARARKGGRNYSMSWSAMLDLVHGCQLAIVESFLPDQGLTGNHAYTDGAHFISCQARPPLC